MGQLTTGEGRFTIARYSSVQMGINEAKPEDLALLVRLDDASVRLDGPLWPVNL